MKNKLSTAIIILLFVAGVSLLLYRPVSIFFSDRQHEQAIQSYIEAVNNMSDEEIDAILLQAKMYNEELAANHRHVLTYLSEGQSQNYPSQLSVPDTDVIAYIEIPSIKVRLPIYHYATDDVLDMGCGHYEVSSLPFGGSSLHSFLCAHRALSTATMFEHLDALSEGDTFTVTVLNQALTYEVDHIQVVEAAITQKLVNDLVIDKGKDYCTLMTCEPYGQTTHRLLVRGQRID